jgi:hypothetical protein
MKLDDGMAEVFNLFRQEAEKDLTELQKFGLKLIKISEQSRKKSND